MDFRNDFLGILKITSELKQLNFENFLIKINLN